MKPKILLAKYLDWAVLAILAAVLAVVAVQSFLLKTTGEEKLRDEINQAERTIQKGMTDTAAEPQKPPDYLGDLKNRFEHPAVMDPYRRNPFLTREDIVHPPIDLRVNVPKEVKFKGTRFTQVVTGDEKRVRVDLAYDLPRGISIVTFTALDAGQTTIRIQTDEDVVHLFQLRASTAKRAWPPNPPRKDSVRWTPHAAVEIKGARRPPMVLISFMPDNPTDPNATIGSSSNAVIYRKPAGAPDAAYRLVTDKPLVPLTVPEIGKIMSDFKLPGWGAMPQMTAPAPAAPAAPAPSEPMVPEEAGRMPRPGPAVEEVVETEPPPLGSFVFLDQTALGGEWYTYKIITLSGASDMESVPCETPVLTPPIYAGPLVEFAVHTISPDRADIDASRRDPDTGEWLSTKLIVGVGMKIGGVVPFKLAPVATGLPKTKDVDFSTGCILVAPLQGSQTVEYNKLRTTRTGTGAETRYRTDYQAKYGRIPQILYLTPEGELKLRNREQ